MNISILDYGAIDDGKTLNTTAIQTAIDACTASGGGRVNVPAGVFLTGTIRLKSNVELHLEHNSILKASNNLNDYNNLDEYPQNYDAPSEGWCGKHLIISVYQENVAITGSGTIDGSGDAFFGGELHRLSNFVWAYGYYKIPEGAPLRPGQMICFIESSYITVTGITMRNSPSWNIFFHGCDYVKAAGLTIINGKQAVNTDGIDIDCCSYVSISDCLINTGDDAIAIRGCSHRLAKNPGKKCEYVTVSNCVLSAAACGVRIGVGYGDIQHINLSGLIIAEAGEAFGLMTGFDGRGSTHIADISIDNITADNIGRPLGIYATSAKIERVTINNYRTKCKAMINVTAKEGLLFDLVLRNVDIYDCKAAEYPLPDRVAAERSDAMISILRAERLILDNVRAFIRDDYFDERSKVIKLSECTPLKKDLHLIYKGSETQVEI